MASDYRLILMEQQLGRIMQLLQSRVDITGADGYKYQVFGSSMGFSPAQGGDSSPFGLTIKNNRISVTPGLINGILPDNIFGTFYGGYNTYIWAKCSGGGDGYFLKVTLVSGGSLPPPPAPQAATPPTQLNIPIGAVIDNVSYNFIQKNYINAVPALAFTTYATSPNNGIPNPTPYYIWTW